MTGFFSFLHQNECECICSPLQRNPNFWFSPQKLQSKFGAMFYQLFWLICWSRLFVVCGLIRFDWQATNPTTVVTFWFQMLQTFWLVCWSTRCTKCLIWKQNFSQFGRTFCVHCKSQFFLWVFFFEKCSFQSLLNSCSVGKYENESRVVILQSQRPLSKPDNIPSSTWLELLYFFSLGVITLLGATIDQIVPFLSHMPFTAPRATASWH